MDAASFLEHAYGDVRVMLPLLEKLEKAQFTKILQAVVLSFSQGEDAAKDLALEQDSVAILYTGLHAIVRAGIRGRTKQDVLEGFLQELKVPAQFVPSIISAVVKQRANIEAGAEENRLSLPTFDDLKWRIDVTISTGALTRVLSPSIMAQTTLSDGSIKSFTMTQEQFHALRFQVAKALKEMHEVSRQPILRVDAKV
eukprot:TRINITY_DN6862_c0_g6_i1.p1 TRINITY_DN6862_c0_g6~~TRINITY_DN6862_c0_g6_i1.p1  ORF type:complete len:198 (-),score=54.96 TRINITY_DN6862_c0_g6_i1:235-828(-)